MRFHVLTQHCRAAIALIAYFASEGLVLPMYNHVFGQMTINVERVATYFTFEYLITRVNLCGKLTKTKRIK